MSNNWMCGGSGSIFSASVSLPHISFCERPVAAVIPWKNRHPSSCIAKPIVVFFCLFAFPAI